MSDLDALRERLLAWPNPSSCPHAQEGYERGVDAALAALEQVTTDAAWVGGPIYRITPDTEGEGR